MVVHHFAIAIPGWSIAVMVLWLPPFTLHLPQTVPPSRLAGIELTDIVIVKRAKYKYVCLVYFQLRSQNMKLRNIARVPLEKTVITKLVGTK